MNTKANYVSMDLLHFQFLENKNLQTGRAGFLIHRKIAKSTGIKISIM